MTKWFVFFFLVFYEIWDFIDLCSCSAISFPVQVLNEMGSHLHPVGPVCGSSAGRWCSSTRCCGGTPCCRLSAGQGGPAGVQKGSQNRRKYRGADLKANIGSSGLWNSYFHLIWHGRWNVSQICWSYVIYPILSHLKQIDQIFYCKLVVPSW